MEPIIPPPKPRRSKGKGKQKGETQDKGKGKSEPVVEVWPPVLELLMQPQSVSEELATRFLWALGCTETTTK